MVRKKIPLGLDEDTASFILDEYERRHEMEAQIVKPNKSDKKLVTTGNFEQIQEEEAIRKGKAVQKEKRDSLIKKLRRLKKEVAELKGE